MKFFFKYSPVFIALFIIHYNNNSSSNGSYRDSIQIDDYSVKIDSLLQTTSPRSFNGVILITQKGKIKYSKAYGYSNFEDKIPITTDDNFRIQSNSKQITAVLILKEVENGKIDLTSPIRKYLPEIKQKWADIVTVHQLLNMSSGIVDFDKPLIFKPGTDFKYSNLAYGLLGRILANVTGKKYTEIANSLFKEIKMNNSFCYQIARKDNNVINGYINSKGKFSLLEFKKLGMTTKSWNDFIPAGGIISNINDLNIWDTKLHNGKILKSQSYELMTTYNITGQHDAFGNKKIGYGYGIRIDDNESVKVIGHAGRGLGFTSIKFYIPKTDVNVIVLENVYNQDESIVYHFEKKIRELVMNSSLIK